jgi:hypothetical protein
VGVHHVQYVLVHGKLVGLEGIHGMIKGCVPSIRAVKGL